MKKFKNKKAKVSGHAFSVDNLGLDSYQSLFFSTTGDFP